jgi:hypothetical protein
MRRDDRRETTMKENHNGRWSSDDVVHWLQRRQNGDAVEWWGEWPRLRWSFYSSGEWESGSPGRVAYHWFNASVLPQGGGWRDKTLLKDEVEVASSSWLNEKEAWHGAAAWQRQLEERWYQGGKGRRRYQLGWHEFYWAKIKKIHAVKI